jgi:hypothetical protein
MPPQRTPVSWSIRHRLQTREHTDSRRSRGPISSETLKAASTLSTFRENVRMFANNAHFEAKRIFDLAKQLEGDPEKATEYVEAVELNRQLLALDNLLSGHHTFVQAITAQDEPS